MSPSKEPDNSGGQTQPTTPSQNEDESPPSEAKGGSTLAREIWERFLPLVVSAGGLATFVIGVGGAVSVARFYGGGLPPHQAVDAAGQSELNVIGLTALIAVGLFGLIAVALAYLASPKGEATVAMYYTLIGVATVEAAAVWWLGKGENWAEDWLPNVLGAGVVLLAAFLAVLVVGMRHRAFRAAQAKEEAQQADLVRALALVPYLLQLPGATRSRPEPPRKDEPTAGEDEPGEEKRGLIAEFTSALAHDVKGSTEKEEEQAMPLRFVDFLLLGVLSVGAAVLAGLFLGHVWVGLSVAFAGAMGLVAIRVADLCRGFRWYAVCIFFSVALFVGVVGVSRALDEPRLQPVAFLIEQRGTAEAVEGIYVGQSDGRLWYASVALGDCDENVVRAGSGRLRSVAEDKVTRISIGPLVGLPKLAHEARAMMDDLMAERRGSELVTQPPAVRDSVAVERLEKDRSASGWWVKAGSVDDLGDHPQLRLNGERLLLRRALDDHRQWEFRVPRGGESGAVYASCGEHTNRAWLTALGRPYAVPTAEAFGNGWWRLDGGASQDSDGHITKYAWRVLGRRHRGRTVVVPDPGTSEPRLATLEVTDDDGLPDVRDVALTAAVTKVFPSDLLFCFDCRQLTPDGEERVLSLRPHVSGARRIVVIGHTDERGRLAYNDELSEARARVVARLLLSGAPSVPKDRDIRGLGERKLKQPGAHRQNRRVVVRIYRGQN